MTWSDAFFRNIRNILAMLRYLAPLNPGVAGGLDAHDKPGRNVRPRHLPLACAIAASAVLPTFGSPAAASPKPAVAPSRYVSVASPSAAAAPARSVALAASTADGSEPTQKEQLLYITNAERARAGLAPLTLRTGVADVARQWAANLARDGRLGHRPDLGPALAREGVTGWRTTGENVGYGPHVSDVHRSFMASPSHRAILMSPDFTEIGIGVTASGGRVWVTVDFVGY